MFTFEVGLNTALKSFDFYYDPHSNSINLSKQSASFGKKHDKPYYQQPTETDMRVATLPTIKALMKQFVDKEKVFSLFFYLENPNIS